MLTVLLGLSGAMVLGAGDFMGGIAAKRIGALRVTAIMSVVGLIGALILGLIFHSVWTLPAILWGAASGIAGSLSVALLYGCLAIGPMSVLSPLTALVGALVPMTWGLTHGESLKPFGYLALGLALVAILLVGVVPTESGVRATPRGILMAVASGTLAGVFLITLNFAPHSSGLVPVVLNRAVSATVILTVLAVLTGMNRFGKTPNRSNASDDPQRIAALIVRPRTALIFACACGVADTTGAALILAGLRVGDLSVMGVLGALYPVGTIALAALVLKEHISKVQGIGLVFALSAAALLGLA